ncbi:MAG TPA: hypothetical protein VK540_18305 [Polyangiaceae bacterium]|nr:hypothetical protein [Polyangiaceae bacterium]
MRGSVSPGNATTNDAARIPDGKAPSKALRIGLWFVQVLLSLTFTGLWKLLTPLSKLAATIVFHSRVARPPTHAVQLRPGSALDLRFLGTPLPRPHLAARDVVGPGPLLVLTRDSA